MHECHLSEQTVAGRRSRSPPLNYSLQTSRRAFADSVPLCTRPQRRDVAYLKARISPPSSSSQPLKWLATPVRCLRHLSPEMCVKRCQGEGQGGCLYCIERELQTPPRPPGTPPLEGRGAAAHTFNGVLGLRRTLRTVPMNGPQILVRLELAQKKKHGKLSCDLSGKNLRLKW